MLDLSPLIRPRASPVVLAIAREMLRIEQSTTPDGAPVVPYLVFLVRPNGIRPYYEARSRLEPLGIAFGYELIEQDLVVEIPDFDDLTTWDGSVPLEATAVAARTAKPRPGWSSTTDSGPSRSSGGSVAGPADDSRALGAWPPTRDGEARAQPG